MATRYSLFSNAAGSFNTATGAGAPLFNTANENTAFGAATLLFNTTRDDNTAVGTAALSNNTTGSENTAVGTEALQFNTDGNPNTAVGYAALKNNLTAGGNTAVGYDALLFNAPSQTASHLAGTMLLSTSMRSLVTLADTAIMLLAPTRFSSMLAALQTPTLVITRFGIMTRMNSVWPMATRQLALRHFSITVMAVTTPPLAIL